MAHSNWFWQHRQQQQREEAQRQREIAKGTAPWSPKPTDQVSKPSA